MCSFIAERQRGYAVARAIRLIPKLKPIYLIAMTGYGQKEDFERAIEAGFDHHVTKPAHPDRIVELIGM